MSTSILTSPWRFVVLFFALFSLTNCATPIVDPMEFEVSNQYSLEEIDAAILRGATELQWLVNKNDKGFVATLDVREHQVVVQILRTKGLITVRYKSSLNMDYDGRNIHNKYHKWVDNLFRNIRKHLADTKVRTS